MEVKCHLQSGESIEARVQIPGAEVADYARMPELESAGALPHRGFCLPWRVCGFRSKHTNNFDDELQRRSAKMRIVELIIDGFKSYAVRTVISGWDDSFNSITGLNGSGKSNILDAICFCLGITTMQVVRAQNLQVCTYYSMFGAFTDVKTIGSDLQAWTSRSHQSQRYYCVRQSRQEEVSHWIRRICSDQCYSSDCAGRHK